MLFIDEIIVEYVDILWIVLLLTFSRIKSAPQLQLCKCFGSQLVRWVVSSVTGFELLQPLLQQLPDPGLWNALDPEPRTRVWDSVKTLNIDAFIYNHNTDSISQPVYLNLVHKFAVG